MKANKANVFEKYLTISHYFDILYLVRLFYFYIKS